MEEKKDVYFWSFFTAWRIAYQKEPLTKLKPESYTTDGRCLPADISAKSNSSLMM